MQPKFSNSTMARVLGVTLAQIQAGHIRNAEVAEKTAARCEKQGKAKISGYTPAEWRKIAAEHRVRATEA